MKRRKNVHISYSQWRVKSLTIKLQFHTFVLFFVLNFYTSQCLGVIKPLTKKVLKDMIKVENNK